MSEDSYAGSRASAAGAASEAEREQERCPRGAPHGGEELLAERHIGLEGLRPDDLAGAHGEKRALGELAAGERDARCALDELERGLRGCEEERVAPLTDPERLPIPRAR